MEYSQTNQYTENSVCYTEKFSKINNLAYRLDKFLYDINENFKKHKYRKCLRDLKEKENIINECEDKWKLNKIKVLCLFKIIEKKYIKYSDNPINLKRVDIWLYRVNIELEKWVDFLDKTEFVEESEFQVTVEFVMKSIIEHIYNCHLYFKKDKKLCDSTAVLALAERLIKPAVYFTNCPDVIYHSTKILLAISTIHIANNNYEVSKIYSTNSLKLCNLELKLRFNFEEDEIVINKLSENELILLEKVGTNFTIAFYHLGVCEENLGNIVKAIEAYKQSKWFANNFFQDSLCDLTQFFTNVEKRAIEYDKFLKEIKSTQPFPKRNHSSERTKNINMKFCKDDSKKYEETLKFLDKLELHEFDQDNSQKKSEYAKKLLSTVYLVNNLMSDRFRDITQTIPQHICNLSKETQEKIQKRLNDIKSEKIFLETENLRKTMQSANINKIRPSIVNNTEDSTRNPNKESVSPLANYTITFTEPNISNKPNKNNDKHSDMDNNLYTTEGNIYYNCDNSNRMNTETKEKSHVSFIKNYPTHFNTSIKQTNIKTSDKSNNFSPSNNNYYYTNNSPKKIKKISKVQFKTGRPATSHPSVEPVQKFEYSKVIFEKNFQNTMSYLDKYIDKEFSFQKKLLKLKTSENSKADVNQYDHRESKTQFETFYLNIIKNSKMKVLKDDSSNIKKKSIINQEDTNLEKIKDHLLVKTLKSLNPKAFNEYIDFNKKNIINQFFSKKETIKMVDMNSMRQKNNETDKKLLRELEYLDKYENYINKFNSKKNEYLRKNTKYGSNFVDDHYVNK